MKLLRSILFWTLLGVLPIMANDPEEKSVFSVKPDFSITKPEGFLKSLIDPSRFSMSQSYSMAVSSMGGRTFNQGLYSNTMTYKFADPLVAQVSIGYAHQPFGGPSDMRKNEQGLLYVQRALLKYKPFKNTTLILDFQQIPSGIMHPWYLSY